MAKIDWTLNETVGPQDMNQIGREINALSADNSVSDAQIGDRTISDAAAPTGDKGKVTVLFGWLANMIKSITGKANWRTAPRTTLENAVKRDGDTMSSHLHVQAGGASVRLRPLSDTDTGVLGIHTQDSTGTWLWGAGGQVSSGKWGVYDYLKSRWVLEMFKDGGSNDLRYLNNIVYHSGNHGNTGNPHPQYALAASTPIAKYVTGRLNSAIEPGMYRLQQVHEDAPSTPYSYGNMLVVRAPGADTITQVIFPYQGADVGKIVFRSGSPTDVGGASTWSPWKQIWNEANMGSGSGLHSDLLDGYHASISSVPSSIVVRNTDESIGVKFVKTEIPTHNSGNLHYHLRNGSPALSALRFGIGLITEESGSNTGSDFGIWRYNDSGASLGNAMLINRATGNVTYAGNVTAPRLVSLVGTGTAPLSVASTTMVPNLNAEMLSGMKVSSSTSNLTVATRDSAGNTGFNRVNLTAAQGTSPLIVTSTTLNTNLNADLLDGLHASAFAKSHYPINYKVAADSPASYPERETCTFFVNDPENVRGWPGQYGTVVSIKSYSNAANYQMFLPYNIDHPIKYRIALYNSNAWLPWRDFLDSSKASTAGTANTVAMRGANGTIKAANPVANDDLATKQYTDSLTGSLSSLQTTAKGNLVAAVNELFTSVGSGKTALAGALTDRGIIGASANDTFAKQSSDIRDFLIVRSGIKWDRLPDPPAYTIVVDLAYGLGMFMAICMTGENNTIAYMTSTNGGATWVNRSFAASGDTVDNLTFVNNRFITTTGSRIYSSTSGTSFSYSGAMPSGIFTRRIPLYAASPGYIAVGSHFGICTSTNLSTWTQRYSGSTTSTDDLYDAAFGNGRFVAVGDKGHCVHSTDGINWSAGSGLGNRDYYSVAFGNGKFVATGFGGYTATSTNGITWTETPSTNGFTNRLDRIIFAGGLFVAISQSNTPFGLASRDGVNWTHISFGNSTARMGVAYDNIQDQYMAISIYTTAHISTRGTPK